MSRSIDVVIIGLNSSRTLEDCVASVRNCRYPRESITIVYADGGSRDGSQAIAERLGVPVLEVLSATPSPGRQRNAGWRSGAGELIQFLDSDTVIDPDWLVRGSAAFADGVGAVCGDVRERYPERSVYNWIGDKEWNGKVGEAESFGGLVLVRREALDATGGYDIGLVAGEDPELAYRVRGAGFRIVKLDAPMARHDLAMYRFGQYWRRAFRSGHAYAEVNAMHPDFWSVEVRRIAARGGGFLLGLCVLPFSFSLHWLAPIPLFAILFLLRPRLARVDRFERELRIDRREARIYAWHASLVVLPQFFGMARYWLGRLLSRPLTNSKALKRR